MNTKKITWFDTKYLHPRLKHPFGLEALLKELITMNHKNSQESREQILSIKNSQILTKANQNSFFSHYAVLASSTSFKYQFEKHAELCDGT